VMIGGPNIKVHIIHAHHLAVVYIDDLLIQDVLLDFQQPLIGSISTHFIARHAGLPGSY